MVSSYALVVLALVSFAGMGIIHKLGDRFSARPIPIALYTVLTAGILSAIRALTTHTLLLHPTPPPILWIAVPFGIATAASIWLFQEGLRYGRIATSWLLINLSAAVPTVLSIVFFHENLGWKKTGVLILIVISLFLLWWDRMRVAPASSSPKPSDVSTEVL